MILTDEALDVQADLFGYYLTEPGARYAGAQMHLAAQSMGLRVETPAASVEEVAFDAGPRLMRDLLRGGTTFGVSADICQVLEVASKTVQPFRLHATDMPSLNGFVWLERPILTHDDTPQAKPIVVRAFGWRSMADKSDRTGLALILWTDPEDPRDHAADEFKTDEALIRTRGAWPPHGLWSMICGLWAYGEIPVASSEAFRLLSAFLRFIDEPWIGDGRERPSRAAGRRALRAGLEPTVRVIRLRRPAKREPGPDTGTRGPLTVRTLVGAATGGFWRNQWYPSIGDHRPKWIWPFERGPADQPLRVPDHIFRVDR